jgi:hypothetical protein
MRDASGAENISASSLYCTKTLLLFRLCWFGSDGKHPFENHCITSAMSLYCTTTCHSVTAVCEAALAGCLAGGRGGGSARNQQSAFLYHFQVVFERENVWVAAITIIQFILTTVFGGPSRAVRGSGVMRVSCHSQQSTPNSR